MFGCAVVYVLLCCIHVVDVIKAVGVPHRQMRVHLDVFGLLSVVNLPAEVLHAGDGATILTNMHDWEEKVAVLLALQRRSQSNNHFKVVLRRCSLARLKGVGGDIGATSIICSSIRHLVILSGTRRMITTG